MQQKAEDRRRRLQQQLEDKQGYVGAYRARVVAKPSHLVFFLSTGGTFGRRHFTAFACN